MDDERLRRILDIMVGDGDGTLCVLLGDKSDGNEIAHELVQSARAVLEDTANTSPSVLTIAEKRWRDAVRKAMEGDHG